MVKIVIIDDRVTNRQILTKLAQSLDDDAQVESFADPLRALAWANDNLPNLVVTDFKMPEMTGAEFVRRFRERPEATHIPVIVVTAYEDRALRYEALAAGATDFLISPLDAVEFRARARNLLMLERQHELIERRNRMLEYRLKERSRLHECELQLSEDRFQLVVNTAPLMINVVDRDGNCLILNNELCRFFGVDPHDALGRPLEDVLGHAYAERHRKLNKSILNKCEKVSSVEEVLIDSCGQRYVFLTTTAPLFDNSGQPASLVTISMDITQRKLVEQELFDAKNLAEASDHAKVEFLANMSHELRTPLNAIIGFSDMMWGQYYGPLGTQKYVEYSRDICHSAKHLLEIINDLLDLSQVGGETLLLDEREVAPGDLIEEVGRILQPQSESAEVALNVSIDGQIPAIKIDPLRFKQALLNIASNALKFTAAGGSVEISAHAIGNRVQIEIVDTGIGMSETDIKMALTRFGRVENALSRRYPGAGIGLPLAADLVRLQGGKLDITSVPDKGTRVTISFPIERTIAQQNWPEVVAG